jgi:hypothetical protein
MSWEETFKVAASYAPLATAAIALCAAIIALWAMRVQRDVARRRAAIDFFFKTEMDATAIDLYENFKRIDVVLVRSTPMPQKLDLQGYRDARRFLNICELIAVGVNHGAFSEQVSLAYWGDVLPASYNRMCALITDIRSADDEGGAETYRDLEKLCERWSRLSANDSFPHLTRPRRSP